MKSQTTSNGLQNSTSDAFHPLTSTEFGCRSKSFIEAKVLDWASVHVIDIIADMVAVSEPDILLGLAFSVRSPQRGSVGVDLRILPDSIKVEADEENEDQLKALDNIAWPDDLEAWHQSVLSCKELVSDPDGPLTPFVQNEGLIIPRRQWSYQNRLAKALESRSQSSLPTIGGRPIDLKALIEQLHKLFDIPWQKQGGKPTDLDLQRLGAEVSVLRPFSVISGGPGTGKTYTIKKVLGLLRDQWQRQLGRDPRVALAAPTGKAAVRMVQAIGEDLDSIFDSPETRGWLKSLKPITIHRLLGFMPKTPTQFRHHRSNPLPHEVIVIDEASMVDLALMCKLVEAVRPEARLILLGDRNQLASVEAGCVLADITRDAGEDGLRFSSEMMAQLRGLEGDRIPEHFLDENPTRLSDGIVHFTKPYRAKEDSGIQTVAYAISNGKLEEAVQWLEGKSAQGIGPFEDLVHIDHDDGRISQTAMGSIINGYLGEEGYLRKLLGTKGSPHSEASHWEMIERLERFRVLCSHRKGHLGVAGLNKAIHQKIEDISKNTPEEFSFLSKHKTSGTWWIGRPILITQNNPETGRTNGDVGVAVRHNGEIRVAFQGMETGKVEYLSTARIPPHETVFAMTVHKSQGSQFDHTFLVMPSRQSPLLTRELVYTALTRSKNRLSIAGDLALFKAALNKRVLRASTLASALWGEASA
jgi:exodeoxyribonuclease V alpha subunit